MSEPFSPAFEARLQREEAEIERREARKRVRIPRDVARRLRADRERRRRQLMVCSMPACTNDVLVGPDGGVGVCLACAFVVVDAIDALDDRIKADEHRLAARERRATREINEAIKAERRAAASAASRKTSPGWIYYVQVGDIVKIGYSKDVRRRLREYPPMSPLLAMHPGTLTLEKELQRQFAGSRSHGREWFLDTPELREHIKVVIEQFGEPDRARYEWRDQHKQRNLKAG